MMRLLALVASLLVLTACSQQQVDQSRVAELGDFRLGHNIVIASKMQMVPASRKATEEEWVTALTDAFADRFERYEGNQLFHFGVSVEGYMLAPPGIPLVAAPKSAVVLNITIWDDTEARKLNETPHQMLIFESLDKGPVVGSGYTNTREEQLANLAFNASRELEKWLADQQEEFGWFDPDPDAVNEEGDPEPRATPTLIDEEAAPLDAVQTEEVDIVEPTQEIDSATLPVEEDVGSSPPPSATPEVEQTTSDEEVQDG